MDTTQNILVVDDNPDNLLVMQKVLKKELPDVEVTSFLRPENVMHYMRTADVSAAIIDVQMPGINGIELCRRIKASEEARHVPVILVTSHEASSRLKAEGLDAGADDFMSRPVDNRELVAHIKVALRTSQTEVTWRKKAERMQQDYQRLFNQTLSGFAVCEMIYDDNGKAVDFRYLTVNPAFGKLIGLPVDKVIGRTVREVFPDDELQWLETYERMIRTGQPAHFEGFVETLDKHFEVMAFNVGDHQFAVSIADISERKQAIARLEESEHRFRAMFEEAPLGVALVDSLTGHMCAVNSKFADIVGRSKDEVVAIDWMKITHPDDVQEDLDNMALLNAGKISGFSMDKRYCCPDGSYVWVRLTVAPITVIDESQPQHLCMVEDITQHKQLEDEREDALRQLSQITNLIPGVVFQYRVRPDGSHCFPYISDAVSDIFHLAPEEIMEDADRAFSKLHPDDRERVIASIQESVKELTPWVCEYRLKLDDGTVHWRLGNAQPRREQDGSALYHGFIIDITERKLKEIEFDRNNQLLEASQAIARIGGCPLLD